jgi:hypothetical protein
MSGVSDGFISFNWQYQISPIILTDGIATQQGGYLPIISLTNPGDEQDLVTSAGVSPELDGFLFNYDVMPGGTLISNQVAMYPFANQAIAANAIIAQPLNISIVMYCPANSTVPYGAKQTAIVSLQSSLLQHNTQGGTYSIFTPFYIYQGCIMTMWRDVSGGESKQRQFAWQLDFIQPLTSLAAASQAQNGAMQKITDGTPPAGTPGAATGLPVQNPTDSLTSNLVPAYASPSFTAPSPLQ